MPEYQSRTVPSDWSGRLTINGPSTDNLAHHWITGKPICIVDIRVSGQPPEGGLTKKADTVVHPVLARPRIPQRTPRQFMQAQGLVHLHNQEQTAIGADLGAVKFQSHPRVKIDPKTALRTRTRRMIQHCSLPNPYNALKYITKSQAREAKSLNYLGNVGMHR